MFFIANLWTYFTTCSSVSFVNFEQVNAEEKLGIYNFFHTFMVVFIKEM